MIFWKYKLVTGDKLPHLKYTSVLPDIYCHFIDWGLFSNTFLKLSSNLISEPLKFFNNISFDNNRYSTENYLLDHQ